MNRGIRQIIVENSLVNLTVRRSVYNLLVFELMNDTEDMTEDQVRTYVQGYVETLPEVLFL